MQIPSMKIPSMKTPSMKTPSMKIPSKLVGFRPLWTADQGRDSVNNEKNAFVSAQSHRGGGGSLSDSGGYRGRIILSPADSQTGFRRSPRAQAPGISGAG